MDYKKLIVDVIGIVLILTTIFFFFIYILFKHNCIDSSLKETWTLTIYFFSGISTLGSVLAVIYTLYRQSIEKRPHFLLELTKMEFVYDEVIEKVVHTLGIRLINTGESAFTLSIEIKHEGNHQNITYGFNNCLHNFDVFKGISETEKHHYLSFNINLQNLENVVTKINNLKLVLTLKYRDKNHCLISEKYSITARHDNNILPIRYELKKI